MPRMLLFVVTALAMTACTKHGHAPARTPTSPPVDLYNLCSDARFKSACTPVPDEQPVRVDTNLTAPRALGSSAG